MGDRVVIVAGATGGIGKIACTLLAEEGASIVAVAGDRIKLSRMQEELKYDERRIAYLSLDLRRYGDWRTVVETAMRKFGGIDVLVNCAGVLVPGPFEELAPSDIGRVVNTNIVNVLNGVRCVLPVMKMQGSGHIITICSLGGLLPMPFESLYCATKFAVRGFCLSLREELRNTGIEISMISPGPVETPLLRLESTSDRSTMAFVERPLEPRFVAEAILRVIRKPAQELVLPGRAKKFASLLSLFPWLFTAIYPVLNFVGALRLKSYRRNLATPAGAGSTEPVYE